MSRYRGSEGGEGLGLVGKGERAWVVGLVVGLGLGCECHLHRGIGVEIWRVWDGWVYGNGFGLCDLFGGGTVGLWMYVC